MMSLSIERSLTHPNLGKLRQGVQIALACLMTWGLFASPASAQLDVRSLIGNSVEEVGPKHKSVERAIQLFRGRDFVGAERAMEEALRSDPMLPPVEVLMAKMHLIADQQRAARYKLEKCVQEHPEDPEPWLIFAEQAFATSRMSDAELLFEKAAEVVKPFNKNATRKKNFEIRTAAGLASIAERYKDWETALGHLQRWAALDPESANAFQRMGRTRFMLGDYKAAYKDFTKVSELDEALPLADVTIARLYEETGQRQEATKFMERAMDNEQANLRSKLAVCRWLVETTQYTKAKPYLEKILKENPDSLEGHLLMGVVLRVTDKQDEARDIFQKAHLLSPSNFDAVNQLAQMLVENTDETSRKQALQFAQVNARVHNKNPEAGIALGWIYYQLGRTTDAERLLNSSLKGGQLTADTAYFVAKIFYDRGRDEAAANLLVTALKTNKIFVHRDQAKELLDKITKKN